MNACRSPTTTHVLGCEFTADSLGTVPIPRSVKGRGCGCHDQEWQSARPEALPAVAGRPRVNLSAATPRRRTKPDRDPVCRKPQTREQALLHPWVPEAFDVVGNRSRGLLGVQVAEMAGDAVDHPDLGGSVERHVNPPIPRPAHHPAHAPSGPEPPDGRARPGRRSPCTPGSSSPNPSSPWSPRWPR